MPTAPSVSSMEVRGKNVHSQKNKTKQKTKTAEPGTTVKENDCSKGVNLGAWMAQSEEDMTLDLGILGSESHIGYRDYSN